MRPKKFSSSALRKNLEVLVLLIVFVFSLVATVGMVSISKNSGLILIDQRVTFGEILSVYTVRTYGKTGSIKDFLSVKYLSESGEKITFNDSVVVESLDALRVGQTIKVFYSAKYPQIASVSGPLLTFLGGVGGIMLYLVLAFVTSRSLMKRIGKKWF